MLFRSAEETIGDVLAPGGLRSLHGGVAAHIGPGDDRLTALRSEIGGLQDQMIPPAGVQVKKLLINGVDSMLELINLMFYQRLLRIWEPVDIMCH